MDVFAAAIGMALLAGLVYGISEIAKARRAKRLKGGLDDLQKRISELPPDTSKEELQKILDNWERGK